MKLTEAIHQVIALTTAITNYWETELPKRHPNFPLVDPDVDDGPPPPEEQQLADLLTSLPEDIRIQLALIMYLGGGYYRVPDLLKNTQKYQRILERAKLTAGELVVEALLGDGLVCGLEDLANQAIDIDSAEFQQMAQVV